MCLTMWSLAHKFASFSSDLKIQFHRFLRSEIMHTRLHSSRMRTARLLTVPQHALQGGVSALGGVCPGGVSQHTLGQTPPPAVNRITGMCKNIILPQLRCGR